MTGTAYLAHAFDANHADLDVDERAEGYPTIIEGPTALLSFIAATRTGVLHDWDTDTHTTRKVAYWLISLGGVTREIYTTAYGRTCTRTMATIPAQGLGCRPARPIPAI